MVTKVLHLLPGGRLGAVTDRHVLSELIPALEALWAELASMWPLLGVPKLVPADGALKAAHERAVITLQQLPAPVRAQRKDTRASRKTCRTSIGERGEIP